MFKLLTSTLHLTRTLNPNNRPLSKTVTRLASTMTHCYGGITTGNRNGKPFAEIIIRPLDGYDCDRSGYIPLNKLSAYVFPNRGRVYKHVTDDDPYADVFRELKKLNSTYYTFITTTRTEVNDNLYVDKWRKDLGSTSILLRIQLLHVGKSSYSVMNELIHEEDPDYSLAKLVHHVTLVDPATRKPVKIPQEFVEKAQKYALQPKLPYRVQLLEPAEDSHHYSTVVRWSDTDIYKHLNTTVYMKYAMDAVYDAVQNEKFTGYVDSEGAFRTKDFLMRFARESLQGQKMDMELWEKPSGVLNLRMSIDGQVVNESLMTSKDHANCVDLSKL